MPYGTEHVLVLTPEVVRRYVPADFEPEAENDLSELVSAMSPSIDQALAAAHKMLLEKRFGKVKINRDRYMIVNTPAGLREFSPMEVGYYGTEDDYPDNYTLGVSLLSRYFPKWLDWRHSHGGSGDNGPIDDEYMEMVKEAREALSPIIPELQDAPLQVIMQWY